MSCSQSVTERTQSGYKVSVLPGRQRTPLMAIWLKHSTLLFYCWLFSLVVYCGNCKEELLVLWKLMIYLGRVWGKLSLKSIELEFRVLIFFFCFCNLYFMFWWGNVVRRRQKMVQVIPCPGCLPQANISHHIPFI